MPVTSFVDPLDHEKTVSFEDAPHVFEDAGVMPSEIVTLLVDHTLFGSHPPSRGHDCRYLSPSQLNPKTTCRRQMVIERFLPYVNDIIKEWSAAEGTIWHNAMARKAPKGWHSEVPIPKGLPNFEMAAVQCEGDARWRIEVLPNLWMDGTVDRLKDDFTVFIDHKSNAYPWTPRPDGNPTDFAEPDPKGRWEGNIREWEIQLSCYAHMIHEVTGTMPEARWIWRLYRGSRNHAKTFRKIPIPLLSKANLEDRIGDFYTSLLDYFDRAFNNRDNEAGLLRIVKEVPMDGHNLGMFGNKKCSKYCAVRDICFNRIEGHGGDFDF